MNTGRILELDGLRTLAITAVLFFHYSPHPNLFRFGWTGVDLFFVISGFLITGILLDLRSDRSPYRTFYWRRALRIFPPYYAVLAVVAVLAFVIHHEPFEADQWFGCLFFVPAIRRGVHFGLILHRILGTAAFDLSSKPFFPPRYTYYSWDLYMYWSLIVEELFYLLWAPVVLTASKRWIAALALGSLVLCPCLRGLTHIVQFTEGIGFLTRFDSLAIGACLSLLLRLRPRLSPGWLIAPIPILIAILIWLSVRCGVLAGREVRSTELFAVCGYSVIALLGACIVGLCVRCRGHRLLFPLRLRPMVYIGTISYTMYLTHFLVYVGVARHVSGNLPRALVAAALTVGIAALSWRYYESPLLRLRNWSPLADIRSRLAPASVD